jgi:hypothetical protein
MRQAAHERDVLTEVGRAILDQYPSRVYAIFKGSITKHMSFRHIP